MLVASLPKQLLTTTYDLDIGNLKTLYIVQIIQECSKQEFLSVLNSNNCIPVLRSEIRFPCQSYNILAGDANLIFRVHWSKNYKQK